jgi:hypothetical protein
MIDRTLLFGALALIGLAYCLWKTQADYRASRSGVILLWGILASLSAFVFVAFMFASEVLSNL